MALNKKQTPQLLMVFLRGHLSSKKIENQFYEFFVQIKNVTQTQVIFSDIVKLNIGSLTSKFLSLVLKALGI